MYAFLITLSTIDSNGLKVNKIVIYSMSFGVDISVDKTNPFGDKWTTPLLCCPESLFYPQDVLAQPFICG